AVSPARFHRACYRRRSSLHATGGYAGWSIATPPHCWRRAEMEPIVFLFDVDNTLLDNDRVAADLKRHLTKEVGEERQRQYWEFFEELRAELGYADYLAPCSATEWIILVSLSCSRSRPPSPTPRSPPACSPVRSTHSSTSARSARRSSSRTATSFSSR